MSDENQETNVEAATTEAKEQAGPQFSIQRVYVKDMSFETPNSPAIFQKDWKPEVKLDLDTRSAKLADNTYEVILSVTVTAKVEGQTAFLAEVQQAGIFVIGNMPEQQFAQVMGAFCPTTLFPYARETISSLVNRGSFPQINISPVNFDALYVQHLQKRIAQAEAEKATTTEQETH